MLNSPCALQRLLGIALFIRSTHWCTDERNMILYFPLTLTLDIGYMFLTLINLDIDKEKGIKRVALLDKYN